MPLYEYVCPKCDRRFEELTPSANADKVKCPVCGARGERQISVFSTAVAPDRSPAAPPPTCQGCPGGGSCPYK